MFGGIGVIIPIGFVACVIGGMLYAFRHTRRFAFAGACGTFAFLSTLVIEFAIQMFAKEAAGIPDSTKFKWTVASFLICLGIGVLSGVAGANLCREYHGRQVILWTTSAQLPPPPRPTDQITQMTSAGAENRCEES